MSATSKKDVSLRTLKNRRTVLVCGNLGSAASTLTAIGHAVMLWIDRAGAFSGDWWYAVAYILIGYIVLMFYFYAAFRVLDTVRIPAKPVKASFKFPQWLEVVVIGLFFIIFWSIIVAYFLSQFIILVVAKEPDIPPPVSCVVVPVSYFISILLLAVLGETCADIREKTDPSFRRAAGFS